MTPKRIAEQDSDSDLDVRNVAKYPKSTSSAQQANRAGLVHGHDVKEMLDQSRKAREEALLGTDSIPQTETVHRIGGRIVSEDEWRIAQREKDPKFRRERQRELDREFDRNQINEYSSGLEQNQERMRKAEEALRVISEPLGGSQSTSSNINYDRQLKEQVKWEDPLVRIKSEYVSPVPTTTMKSFFQSPVNRFNIPPGYRWDGVVRGTNYEQRWFERQSNNS